MEILAWFLLSSIVYDSIAALIFAIKNIEVVKRHKGEFGTVVIKDFILNALATIFFIVFIWKY